MRNKFKIGSWPIETIRLFTLERISCSEQKQLVWRQRSTLPSISLPGFNITAADADPVRSRREDSLAAELLCCRWMTFPIKQAHSSFRSTAIYLMGLNNNEPGLKKPAPEKFRLLQQMGSNKVGSIMWPANIQKWHQCILSLFKPAFCFGLLNRVTCRLSIRETFGRNLTEKGGDRAQKEILSRTLA